MEFLSSSLSSADGFESLRFGSEILRERVAAMDGVTGFSRKLGILTDSMLVFNTFYAGTSAKVWERIKLFCRLRFCTAGAKINWFYGLTSSQICASRFQVLAD
ncbi:hypothetical protein RYX36_020755 [Vicia faba]